MKKSLTSVCVLSLFAATSAIAAGSVRIGGSGSMRAGSLKTMPISEQSVSTTDTARMALSKSSSSLSKKLSDVVRVKETQKPTIPQQSTSADLKDLQAQIDELRDFVQHKIQPIVVDGEITIDAELSETSTNPVQNWVITDALNNFANDDITHRTSLYVGSEAGDYHYGAIGVTGYLKAESGLVGVPYTARIGLDQSKIIYPHQEFADYGPSELDTYLVTAGTVIKYAQPKGNYATEETVENMRDTIASMRDRIDALQERISVLEQELHDDDASNGSVEYVPNN